MLNFYYEETIYSLKCDLKEQMVYLFFRLFEAMKVPNENQPKNWTLHYNNVDFMKNGGDIFASIDSIFGLAQSNLDDVLIFVTIEDDEFYID